MCGTWAKHEPLCHLGAGEGGEPHVCMLAVWSGAWRPAHIPLTAGTTRPANRLRRSAVRDSQPWKRRGKRAAGACEQASGSSACSPRQERVLRAVALSRCSSIESMSLDGQQDATAASAVVRRCHPPRRASSSESTPAQPQARAQKRVAGMQAHMRREGEG